jgi:hypothetical protein
MSDMSIEEIIAADMRNYLAGKFTFEDMFAAFTARIMGGELVYRHGNTLFTVKPVGAGVECHSMNAESFSGYVKNIESLCCELRDEGYEFVCSEFSNKKILSALSLVPFKTDVTSDVTGADTMYKITVRLK